MATNGRLYVVLGSAYTDAAFTLSELRLTGLMTLNTEDAVCSYLRDELDMRRKQALASHNTPKRWERYNMLHHHLCWGAVSAVLSQAERDDIVVVADPSGAFLWLTDYTYGFRLDDVVVRVVALVGDERKLLDRVKRLIPPQDLDALKQAEVDFAASTSNTWGAIRQWEKRGFKVMRLSVTDLTPRQLVSTLEVDIARYLPKGMEPIPTTGVDERYSHAK